MFQIEFTRDGETQTVGYPFENAALNAATALWADPLVTSVIVTNHVDLLSPVVIESLSRA
jgi:hypothetical protein